MGICGIEEAKEAYKGLKKNAFIVESIDKDFFLKFGETLLNELDKKDKEIKELKQDIKEAMGKDRDCLTFGYHSAYVGLIDDLINIIEED